MAIPGLSSIIGSSPGAGFKLQQTQFGGSGGIADNIYKIKYGNWYKSRPYGFVHFSARAQNGDSYDNRTTMWLPISPENLKVTTHYATNIITTLYGVVEEHSEVRYYDIVISGTTGFAPRYVRPVAKGNADQSGGRKAFEPEFEVNLGGFFQQQVGVLNSVVGAVSDVAEVFTGTPNPTGISHIDSGYVAFHNLYRFLIQYKRDAAGTDVAGQLNLALGGQRKVHPLQFLNYKDDIKYDVVPINFTLTRSSENPMLYNYNIVMRGFNLRNVNANPPGADPLAALGLGTTDQPLNSSSLFNKFSGVANGAGNLIGGLF